MEYSPFFVEKLQGWKSVQRFPAKNEWCCSYVIKLTILIRSVCFDTDAIRVQQKAVDGFSELWFMFLLTNEYLCHVKLPNKYALDRSE